MLRSFCFSEKTAKLKINFKSTSIRIHTFNMFKHKYKSNFKMSLSSLYTLIWSSFFKILLSYWKFYLFVYCRDERKKYCLGTIWMFRCNMQLNKYLFNTLKHTLNILKLIINIFPTSTLNLTMNSCYFDSTSSFGFRVLFIVHPKQVNRIKTRITKKFSWLFIDWWHRKKFSF